MNEATEVRLEPFRIVTTAASRTHVALRLFAEDDSLLWVGKYDPLADGSRTRCVNTISRTTGLDSDTVCAALLAEQQTLETMLADFEGAGSADAETLLVAAREAGAEPWRDLAGNAWCTVQHEGRPEHLRASPGGPLHDWLLILCQRELGSVNRSAAASVCELLAAEARLSGEEHDVFVRVAPDPDEADLTWLDLGDPARRVVRLAPSGWEVMPATACPVRFRRDGIRPLPVPERGGSLNDLRPLVNVDEADWPRLLAWLVAVLVPADEYPILLLGGEHDVGKTTLARTACELIDPGTGKERRAPKDARDMLAAAVRRHVFQAGNLQTLRGEMSDAFARLATGAEEANRRLYTDDGEAVMTAVRPIIANGIGDIATRPDLASRVWRIDPPVLDPSRRRSKRELTAEVGRVRARVLGALLDAVTTGLANRATVLAKGNLPGRMADAAALAIAAEPALPVPEGSIRNALAAAAEAATFASADHPLVPALRSFVEREGEWEGSASDLLKQLEPHRPAGTRDGWREGDWPDSPERLGIALARLAPDLRAAHGVEAHKLKSRATGRKWAVQRLDMDSNSAIEPREQKEPHC